MNNQRNKNKAKRLSIIHLVYWMELWGMEVSIAQQASDQKERGADVTVVCLYENGKKGEELKAKGIEVIALNLRRGRGLMNLIRPLSRICKERKIDVINNHVVGVEMQTALVVLWRRIKKSIYIIHAPVSHTGWRKWRGILRAKIANLCFDRIVMVSEALKEHHVRSFKIKPERISVVLNGVDPEVFYPRTIVPEERAKALGLDFIGPNTFVVGTAVQLKAYKDVPTLIRAAVRVKQKQGGGVMFVVAGVGPLKARLKALVKELGIEDCFKLVGWIKDMPNFLAAVDLLALTSVIEGLGTIVVQAMATGLPVVVTDSIGVRDCIVNNESGFMVAVGDDKAVANSIINLINDRELSKKMGKAGKERACKYFSFAKELDEYWDLIVN